MRSNVNRGFNHPHQTPAQGASSSHSASSSTQRNPQHNPSSSTSSSTPPRYYPLIGDNGTISNPSSANLQEHHRLAQQTGGMVTGVPVPQSIVMGFPIAPTIEAALAYNNRIHGTGGASSSQNHPACPPSVLKFLNSTVFSEAQKQGIQAFYRKYLIPIGMAHQLESLADCRREFILDDHKKTPPHKFESMKQEICKWAELLVHIPKASISIRKSSDFYNSTTFTVDEAHSGLIFSNIANFLHSIPQVSHSNSLQEVYQRSVREAVAESMKEGQEGRKTISYVFSARDLTGGNDRSTSTMLLAKNLTKAVINRPENIVPTAFFPDSYNPASNEIIDKLDGVAKNVGVIRPFAFEYREVLKQQTEKFPFSEGCYIQASLLCPVNRFWDEIDEGRIFGKEELEDHLGIRLEEREYDDYYNSVLNRQAELFMQKQKAEKSKGASSSGRSSRSMHRVEFETSTNSPKVKDVPALMKRIEEFRNHPDYTPEVERGINRLCTENNIPIGMGLHMIQLAGRHHEFNIDDSWSMSTKEKGSPYSSRMAELKALLEKTGKFLSYLPTKGVTISCLNHRFGDGKGASKHKIISVPSNHPQFLDEFKNTIRDIQLKREYITPLNTAARAIYDRAGRRDEISNTIFFTDGEPYETNRPRITSCERIVSSPDVRDFIKLLSNRDPQKIPVTIAQATNDPNAIAWTNLCDNVCKNVNAIDDKANETEEVRAHHGKHLPYDENIYVMALLLGNDNKLFDGLDEDGIFSKAALETLYGRPMKDTEYDRYYDDAYDLQCAPGTKLLTSDRVMSYEPKTEKPESSASGFLRLFTRQSRRSEKQPVLPAPEEKTVRPDEEASKRGEGTSQKPVKSLQRIGRLDPFVMEEMAPYFAEHAGDGSESDDAENPGGASSKTGKSPAMQD